MVGSFALLMLCFAMLVGSTFAWFTDSVSTGVNQIKTGNLKVGLKYSYDMVTWNDAENTSEIFSSTDKWEPGFTRVVYFEIENQGNLALDYQVGTNLVNTVVGMNQAGDPIDLTKYIKFGVTNVNATFGSSAEARAAVANNAIDFNNLLPSKQQLLPGAKATMAMVVYMPETVGNEANHDGINVPSIKFGVYVAATQSVSESDSYGNTYDVKADNTPDKLWEDPVADVIYTYTDSKKPVVNTENEMEALALVADTKDGNVTKATVPAQNATAVQAYAVTPEGVSATPTSIDLTGKEIRLSVAPVDIREVANTSITLPDGTALLYDVEVTTIVDGTTYQVPATVEMTIPAAFEVSSVTHHGSNGDENFTVGGEKPLTITDNGNGTQTLRYALSSYSHVSIQVEGDAVLTYADNTMVPFDFQTAVTEGLVLNQDVEIVLLRNVQWNDVHDQAIQILTGIYNASGNIDWSKFTKVCNVHLYKGDPAYDFVKTDKIYTATIDTNGYNMTVGADDIAGIMVINANLILKDSTDKANTLDASGCKQTGILSVGNSHVEVSGITIMGNGIFSPIFGIDANGNYESKETIYNMYVTDESDTICPGTVAYDPE